jgi:deoxycytidine triphosphate deaminase
MSASERVVQSVLIDKDILRFVNEGKLFTAGFSADQLSGSAYDLRAGDTLTSRQRSQRFDLAKADFILLPGETVTVQSFEQLNLENPMCMALILSSHRDVSQGVFHPTTSIDPGFSGPLTITMINLGNVGYRLRRHDRIAKVVFMQVSTPDRIYGKTQSPSVLQGSLDHSLVVDRADAGIEMTDWDQFFGGPLRSLASHVKALEGQRELFATKQRLQTYQAIGAFVATLITGAVGGIIANKWDNIVLFFTHH